MTNGGPGDASRVYGMYIYQNAFRFFDMGYASAMSYVLFVVILVFTIIQLRVTRSGGEDISFM
jgi:multiple sugar transport system permease protein